MVCSMCSVAMDDIPEGNHVAPAWGELSISLLGAWRKGRLAAAPPARYPALSASGFDLPRRVTSLLSAET